MASRLRIALIGDYDPAVTAHQAIPAALQMCGSEGIWFDTGSIWDPEVQLREFGGVWCVPASPYASLEGALMAIRYARESLVPFLGTCAGFQHAAIEYARNMCGLTAANHAETDPDAGLPLVAPLVCSLVEQREEIVLMPGGLLEKIYGAGCISEEYHCNYGLNPQYQGLLFQNGLRPAAHNLAGEVRAIELDSHPFFVATLFQGERRALRGEVPPLVHAFVQSVAART